MPFSDEYGGTKSPWCETDAVVGGDVKDYACNVISCYMERVLVTDSTGNTVDFNIEPTGNDTTDADKADTLEIQIGRAMLMINPTEF